MKNTVISNIKEAICGRNFLISSLLFFVLILLSQSEMLMEAFREGSLLPGGFHSKLVLSALNSDMIILSLPLLCTLPMTAAFIEDMKSGFIKVYLSRTTVKGYILGKIIGCALSGGMVFTVGIYSAYGFSALIFSPMETASQIGEITSPFVAISEQTLLFFFSGAFWSVLGMTLASLTYSKYMAYASPFVIFYVLIILYERYFDNLYVLYPREWLNPSSQWMFGNIGVTLLLLELTIITAFSFAYIAKRRINEI
jgi:hypothetical protein